MAWYKETTMTIKLSEQQINVLNTLLQRTTLKGEEVPAYLDLIQTINASIKETESAAE